MTLTLTVPNSSLIEVHSSVACRHALSTRAGRRPCLAGTITNSSRRRAHRQLNTATGKLRYIYRRRTMAGLLPTGRLPPGHLLSSAPHGQLPPSTYRTFAPYRTCHHLRNFWNSICDLVHFDAIWSFWWQLFVVICTLFPVPLHFNASK